MIVPDAGVARGVSESKISQQLNSKLTTTFWLNSQEKHATDRRSDNQVLRHSLSPEPRHAIIMFTCRMIYTVLVFVYGSVHGDNDAIIYLVTELEFVFTFTLPRQVDTYMRAYLPIIKLSLYIKRFASRYLGRHHAIKYDYLCLIKLMFNIANK